MADDQAQPAGLPALDEVRTVTISGETMTVTQEDLERCANRSNCVWRLRAEQQIADLERRVERLAALVALLGDPVPGRPADSDPPPGPDGAPEGSPDGHDIDTSRPTASTARTMAAAPFPNARISLILTPLASIQFPQVAGDLTNVVGVRSEVSVNDVGRCQRGRIFKGARFSFTVPAETADGIMVRALRAVALRYGESSSIRAEVFAVPCLAPGIGN